MPCYKKRVYLASVSTLPTRKQWKTQHGKGFLAAFLWFYEQHIQKTTRHRQKVRHKGLAGYPPVLFES